MTDEDIGIQMSELDLTAASEVGTGSNAKKKKKKKKGRGVGGAERASSFEVDNTSLGFDIYDTSQDIAIEPLPEYEYSNPSNLQAERSASNPVHARGRSTFFQHQSGEGYTYYEDTESGETVWDLPEGGQVVDQ